MARSLNESSWFLVMQVIAEDGYFCLDCGPDPPIERETYLGVGC